jgi:hypothetical protein
MHLSLIKLHYIGFLNYMTIRFVVHLEQYFFKFAAKVIYYIPKHDHFIIKMVIS